MEHKKCSVEKFTWKIKNFSRVNVEAIPSECFVLGGYPWRIILKGWKGNNRLSISLEVDHVNEFSERWNRDVKFNLLVLNQLNTNRTISKACDFQFNPSQKSSGFQSIISLAELHDPNKGFIVNDTCIVGVEVCVCKLRYEKPVNQTEHIEVEVPKPNSAVQGYEMDSTKDPDADLVCSVLGRVIYFLKTRKVKDMNEQACKELQGLWDELKKFKFDLTWLELQVQYALGMKNYVENAIQVEKLKENVVVQELEIERLKTKLVAAEVNLDTQRNLLKAKGLKEVDLDSELGCGSWRP